MAETASTRIRRSVRFAQLENQTGSLRTEAAKKMPLAPQLAGKAQGEQQNFNEYRI